MFKIAILASTNGTDLQAIIDELKSGNMPGIELTLVASNKEDCYALQRASEQGYETLFLDPSGKSRLEFDQELAATLKEQKIDLIVLVGYMRILSPEFVRKFPRQIINVHPSLIPKYCGKNFYGKSVHEAVLANNESQSGMTIHYIDEGVDTGEIILQKSCSVDPGETADSLKAKVQELEKTYYPQVIRTLAEKA
jgi:phosphoribosylglycinamide formyltransferase 1